MHSPRMSDDLFGDYEKGVATGTEETRYCHDTVLRLLREARRARHEEQMDADRIHALEAQQAELIRQVKELTDEIRLRGDAMEGLHQGNLELSAKVVDLEVQQAELIRQVEEVTAQRDEVKAALDASDDQHRDALATIRALADALEALNNRRVMHYVSSPGHHTVDITNHEVANMVSALRLAKRL